MNNKTNTVIKYLLEPYFVLSAIILLILLNFFAEIYSFIPTSIDNRVLVMIQFLFVLSTLANKKIKFPPLTKIPKVILFVFSTWLVWVCISTVNAQDQNYAFLYFLELLINILFAMSLWSFLKEYYAVRWYVLLTILIGFLMYMVFFSANYLFKPITYPFYPQFLHDVGFNHIRHFGHYLTIVLVISYGFCLYVKFNWRNPLMLFGAGVSVISWCFIFWAGGRGPIFAFFVSLTIYLLFIRRKSDNNSSLLTLITGSLLLGAVLSINLPKGYGIERIIQTFEASATVNEFSTSRLDIWRTCLSDIVERPLLGDGPGAYGFINGCGKELGRVLHPHNSLIQFSLDWGVPGALLFFLLLALLLNHARLSVKNNEDSLINSIGLWLALMLLVFSLISGPLYFRFSVTYFLLAIVFSLLTNSSITKSETTLGSK